MLHVHTLQQVPHYAHTHPSGTAALPVLWEFLKLYPTPDAAKSADVSALAKLLNPLGLHEKRAETIVKFSGMFCSTGLVNIIILLVTRSVKLFIGLGKYNNYYYLCFVKSR